MQEARRCPMHTLFYLSESLVGAYQTALSPFSRCSRVDDRRVVSGIIYAIKHAADEYGPHKTRTIALSGGAGSVFSIKFSLS